MEFNDKLADKFADIVESRPVLYQVYCYYDKDLDRFNQPQINEQTPEFVTEACIASIRKGKFDLNQCAGLCLVHLGNFDIATGKFELFDKPVLLVDCSKYLKKAGEANE